MDFAVPDKLAKDLKEFTDFLRNHMEPFLNEWYKKEFIPR
jgi:hypothetical protein